LVWDGTLTDSIAAVEAAWGKSVAREIGADSAFAFQAASALERDGSRDPSPPMPTRMRVSARQAAPRPGPGVALAMGPARRTRAPWASTERLIVTGSPGSFAEEFAAALTIALTGADRTNVELDLEVAQVDSPRTCAFDSHYGYERTFGESHCVDNYPD
jgi:hypothetical protein